MLHKKLIVGLAGGAAAVSLVGAGVGASFTDSASAAQSITRGTIGLLLSTDNGGSYSAAATFAPKGPVGSAAQAWDQTIKIYNPGNINEYVSNVNISQSGPENIAVSSVNPPYTLNNGDNAIPANALEVPAGQAVTYTAHFVEAAAPNNSYQGTTSTVTITMTGMDG